MTTAIQGDGTVSKNGATGTDLLSGLAKAWVDFDGTGTVAIDASLNTSSISDLGTGVYEANYTNNFAAADYGYVFGGSPYHCQSNGGTTSKVDIRLYNSGNAANDYVQVCMAAFGGLA